MSSAAAWGPLSHELERVRVLLGLRRLVLAWQGPDGDWKHMLRSRDDMVPQAEARLFEDLFAVYREGADAPSWPSVLTRWHAEGGWFQGFESVDGTGFYAGLLEPASTPPPNAAQWLDLTMPALAAAANDAERRGALHGQRQAVLESALSLSQSDTEEDFRAYALRLARRLFAAEAAAWLAFSNHASVVCLAEESEAGVTDEFWRLPAEDMAALRAGRPVLVHRPELSHGAGASFLASPFGSTPPQACLVLMSRSGRTYSAWDQFTFSVFCRQAEGVLENRRLLLRLKAANLDLTAAQARLVESARLQTLGEVAASVAHDFNNVLGALLGRVQLLQHKNSDSGVQSALAKMERILGEGEDAVKRLQEAARGKRTEARLTLDGLVRDVFSASEPGFRREAQIKDRKVVWLTEFLPTGTVERTGRLRPVLRQLLAELAAAVPTDSVIVLSTGRRGGADCFTITVATDPSSPDPVPAWHALPGYAAFALAMEQAGATLELESNHGETRLGAHFSEHPAGTPERFTQPLRVLVVDDDRDVRDVLSEMLMTAGHEVRVAEDGADALSKFESGLFDIVFTDLGMPGISGWQVAEHIKREAPDLPVVMVTGWGHQLDPMQVERSGVSKVLTKPFHWLTVLDTLQALVPHPSARPT